MGRELQIEEREILDSIFPDEIQDISDTEYRISIHLDISCIDEEHTEPLIVLLRVEYPPEYPDEPPILDLLRPPNASPHRFFNLSEDKITLLDSLKEIVADYMGMAMVFTLVSTLKENAEQLIADRQRKWQQDQEQQRLEIEREENKKFYGTPVTPETFASWREEFKKEMEEIKRKEDEQEDAVEKKKNKGKDIVVALTGKQLWARGMVGKIEEEDERGEDATVLD
ncbi:BgTH12-07965 [Blumeria graminis f. sp. triticale]|uniref:BgTH12-07965 n=1 Tax=Blumeria graminis f. sp. triticale TaxID=1689686 RepID=A0A9W4DQP0_BLUGR|nr:BgTH12-07965 [Blumeria graminis f. sp. triticale]